MEGITQNELKDMLRGIAWGRVTEEWGTDLQGRPKLSIMKSPYESGHQSSCACVPNKVHRSILAKLRGALFRLELKQEDGGGCKRGKDMHALFTGRSLPLDDEVYGMDRK